MADYSTVKKQILHKYLVDVPTVTNVRPHAFLISDFYHYLKNTKNGNTIRPLLRTWVSDLSNDFIPLNTLTSFMQSPYFGSCDEGLLNVTQKEFILGPLNAFYDAGIYGELWDGKTVELKGTVTPFAQALFDMTREQNADLFAYVSDRMENPVKVTPYGALEPVNLPATSIGTIYDPFIAEFSSMTATDCDNISCGIAKNNKIPEDIIMKLENYIKTIAKIKGLVIGGGAKVDFKFIYNGVKDTSIRMTKYYLESAEDEFKKVLDNNYLEYIYGIINGVNPSVEKIKELYYIMQFSCNRIFNQNYNLLFHQAGSTLQQNNMNAYCKNKIDALFAAINNKLSTPSTFTNVFKEIAGQNYPTLEHELFNCGSMNFVNIEFDIAPGVTGLVCNKTAPPKYTLDATGLSISMLPHTVYEYKHNGTDHKFISNASTAPQLFNENNNNIIVSSLLFMRSYYAQLLRNAGIPADKIVRDIECIGLSYDYIIIEIGNPNGFYGAVLN
jgi:hypothetical protein